ncbi:MAG: glycine cleavage system protein GcvH [Nitrospinota bacterium]|jgi:glycine cleavage system H protein|nr:glycine cleavage system protein GcvH [Nitrospinota bacterium]MDP6619771.1 glycine cleavage system protein GcvH [Nitrospinota bacterium]
MEYPGELQYTKEHEWVLIEGDNARVGITDYAQSQLGDVVYVELPEAGSQVETGNTFGVVESVKAVSDLFVPVSGTVKEINNSLEETPEIINTDPYVNGWMIVIEMSDKSELDELLSAEDYQTYVKEESQ